MPDVLAGRGPVRGSLAGTSALLSFHCVGRRVLTLSVVVGESHSGNSAFGSGSGARIRGEFFGAHREDSRVHGPFTGAWLRFVFRGVLVSTVVVRWGRDGLLLRGRPWQLVEVVVRHGRWSRRSRFHGVPVRYRFVRFDDGQQVSVGEAQGLLLVGAAGQLPVPGASGQEVFCAFCRASDLVAVNRPGFDAATLRVRALG